MKATLCALALLGLASASPKWSDELDIVDFSNLELRSSFGEWQAHFGKTYGSTDEEYTRFGVWADNVRRIAKYNSQGLSSKLRANQFADMTDAQFKRAMFGEEGSCFKAGEEPIRIGKGRLTGEQRGALETLADGVDWTTAGCVTPVKDQGQCGSCWAFSTTGSIECNWAIAKGQCKSTLVGLSEQELVDCSKVNAGCNGGNMASAMSYVTSNGGLCSESEYPYKGVDGSCKASSCGTKYDAISNHKSVTADSESSLATATNAGCVSVAIEADQFAFQYYSSGVLDGTCGTNLDHGVLVVGYGTLNNEEYWKVKNSWGTSWGEAGYVLICRDCGKNGKQGECGIAMEPVQPVV
jgi:C1A family cysteine protease